MKILNGNAHSQYKKMAIKMKNLKYIFSLIFILSVIFTSAYSAQKCENNISNLSDLESYYINKMTMIYIDGYDVDINGQLIMSQYQFEHSVKEVSNEMLSDGLNHQQIERVKDEARKIGQEARKSWDTLRKSLKEENNTNL